MLVATYVFSAAFLINLQMVSWTLERMKVKVWTRNTLSLVGIIYLPSMNLLSRPFF